MGLVSAVVGLVAWGQFNMLKQNPTDSGIRSTLPYWNNAGDALLLVSIFNGIGSIVFFVLDYAEKPVVVTE